MTYTTYKLKKFVNEFFFPSPDWDNLPMDFPNCDIKGLTKEEKYIFEAIKFAWIIFRPTKPGVLATPMNQSRLISFLYNSKFSKIAFSTFSMAVIIFSLISISYYANVNLNLGIKFLSEFFA